MHMMGKKFASSSPLTSPSPHSPLRPCLVCIIFCQAVSSISDSRLVPSDGPNPFTDSHASPDDNGHYTLHITATGKKGAQSRLYYMYTHNYIRIYSDMSYLLCVHCSLLMPMCVAPVCPGYVNEIGAWRANAESGLAALKRQPIQIANSTSDLFLLVLRWVP